MPDKKVCEYCGQKYYPAGNQWKKQKFCSVSCKDKKAYYKNKAEGHIRMYKGGYPRQVVIRKWIEAQANDLGTVGCHYCQKRITPDNFVLDHKKPITKLTRHEVKDENNLVICCHSCNIEKGSKFSYKEFLERKRHG